MSYKTQSSRCVKHTPVRQCLKYQRDRKSNNTEWEALALHDDLKHISFQTRLQYAGFLCWCSSIMGPFSAKCNCGLFYNQPLCAQHKWTCNTSPECNGTKSNRGRWVKLVVCWPASTSLLSPPSLSAADTYEHLLREPHPELWLKQLSPGPALETKNKQLNCWSILALDPQQLSRLLHKTGGCSLENQSHMKAETTQQSGRCRPSSSFCLSQFNSRSTLQSYRLTLRSHSRSCSQRP